MIAVMNRAGVTSNAGCAAGTSGEIFIPRRWVTSSADRSSIGICAPVAADASSVDIGAAT